MFCVCLDIVLFMIHVIVYFSNSMPIFYSNKSVANQFLPNRLPFLLVGAFGDVRVENISDFTAFASFCFIFALR